MFCQYNEVCQMVTIEKLLKNNQELNSLQDLP